jgi:hypothetical protein
MLAFVEETVVRDMKTRPAERPRPKSADFCYVRVEDTTDAVPLRAGHAIGLMHADVEDDLMADLLQPGTRRLPTTTEVDEVFARGLWLT